MLYMVRSLGDMKSPIERAGVNGKDVMFMSQTQTGQSYVVIRSPGSAKVAPAAKTLQLAATGSQSLDEGTANSAAISPREQSSGELETWRLGAGANLIEGSRELSAATEFTRMLVSFLAPA
jgi:hypothetical protein